MDASPSPRPDGRRRPSPVLGVALLLGVAALLVGVLGLVTGLGAPGVGPVGFAVTTVAGGVVLLTSAVGWLMARMGGRTGPFA